MTISTRFGSDVKFVEAKPITVWIEHRPGKVVWHYSAPPKKRRDATVREEPAWHVRADYLDGSHACDGKWIFVGSFVADNGINEILAECRRLNPDGKAKYEEWAKKSGPRASDLFGLTPDKDIA
jgi:hypothetical protein